MRAESCATDIAPKDLLMGLSRRKMFLSGLPRIIPVNQSFTIFCIYWYDFLNTEFEYRPFNCHDRRHTCCSHADAVRHEGESLL
ncbi:hypothetical protein CUJ84_pRLN2000396 (plasmid) [Rhizobium leguminosarum]|uniref:Uncharacterized protein n=1 Tax=Rhizobium leguminosarum TaxID=384 RepID=A0A2K9ZFB6_RHILE|nr:hypothetical protein CUJ84_pRLN2000396 [Rhizobium leguminosarum]